jgi:uncharacterized protein YfkK (UPF0435 family)
MDVREYQEIKGKLDVLNRGVVKAEGSYERILSDLHDKFNCNTVEDAERVIKETEEDIKGLEERKETLWNKLQGVTDWTTL